MVQRKPIKYEDLDYTPVSIPLRFTRKSSLSEVVRHMVRSEQLAKAAEEMGYETFEEADDFDVGDDYDPHSPYEMEHEGLPVAELRRRKLVDDEERKKPPAAAKPTGDPAPIPEGEEGGGR